MTSILLAVAARYVASTSNLFINNGGEGCSDKPADNPTNSASAEGLRPTKRRKRSETSTPPVEPRVVILDLEKGVHAVKLILGVREAVLRRWEETAAARQWKREQDKLWTTNESETTDTPEEQFNNTLNEQREIEHAIASCLGRINIVQPRDFTYLSLVATVEALRQSLDNDRGPTEQVAGDTPKKPSSQFGHQKSNAKPSSTTVDRQHPPTLILIDSLTTLDASTRYLESLSTTTSGSNRIISGGSGLSDRNEFYRQLIRLREEHETAIVATSRCASNAHGRSSHGLWEKMVSHKVNLHHVAEQTQEDQAGYDFVATLNSHESQEGANVFPYSVTAGGIAC